jgi:hypothetical protein
MAYEAPYRAEKRLGGLGKGVTLAEKASQLRFAPSMVEMSVNIPTLWERGPDGVDCLVLAILATAIGFLAKGTWNRV